MTDEPPLTIMPDTKGWERIVANQRQALYEKEQELERLRAENARLTADSRRWRTVERAVEKNEGTLMLFQERSAHPDQRFVIGTMGRFSSGHYETEARESTLAAAVDALAERMDKEAK